MAAYEYSVIPAPAKGTKAKGVKTPEARFAYALQELMNEMGGDGWEYQRAETLPSTDRSGLTGSATQWRHVLVFRRALDVAPPVEDAPVAPEPLKLEHKIEPEPKPVAAPAPTPTPTPTAATKPEPKAKEATPKPEPTPEPTLAKQDPHPAGQPGATKMQADNGVEETSDVAGLTTSLETLAKTRKSPFDSDP